MNIMGNPDVTYVDLRKNLFSIVILGFFNVQFPMGKYVVKMPHGVHGKQGE